jgi:hypothetical protein
MSDDADGMSDQDVLSEINERVPGLYRGQPMPQAIRLILKELRRLSEVRGKEDEE